MLNGGAGFRSERESMAGAHPHHVNMNVKKINNVTQG